MFAKKFYEKDSIYLHTPDTLLLKPTVYNAKVKTTYQVISHRLEEDTIFEVMKMILLRQMDISQNIYNQL